MVTPLSGLPQEGSPVSGWRILLLDADLATPLPAQNHYRCVALARALQRHPEVAAVERADLATALDLARRRHCNLFIALGAAPLPRYLVERLRTACGKALLWSWAAQEDATWPLYDQILVAAGDPAGTRPRLPPAASVAIHGFEVAAEAALRYDLYLAGRPNAATLARLDASLAGGPWRVRLPQWWQQETVGEAAKRRPLPMLDRVAPRERARFANLSRATLLLPDCFPGDEQIESAAELANAALEAALAGSPLLVHASLAKRLPGLEPGQYLEFTSDAALLEQLRRLREHPAQRAALASAARDRVLAEHRYEHRAATLVETARALATPVVTAPATPPRILHVTGRPGHPLLQRLLAQGGLRHLIYSCAGYPGSNRVELADGEARPRRFRFDGTLSPLRVSCPDREKLLAELLLEEGIDLVHVHDLQGHVPSLIPLATALGVAVVFSADAYYAICHRRDLLDDRGRYCEPELQGQDQCDACLASGDRILRHRQGFRRTVWNAWLQQCRLLVFPNRMARELHAGIYPAVAQHGDVVTLSELPGQTAAADTPAMPTTPVRPLAVYLPGPFSPQRGAEIALMAMIGLAKEQVEFFVEGPLDARLRWRLAIDTGPLVHIVKPGALARMVRGMDVTLHLPPWPDPDLTVIQTAAALGAVPLVTTASAGAELIRDGDNGVIVQPDHVGDVVLALRGLSRDRARLERLRAAWRQTPTPTLERSAEALAASYSEIIGNLRWPRSASAHLPESVTRAMLKMLFDQKTWSFFDRKTLRRKIVEQIYDHAVARFHSREEA
jgi:glycosyltransferase involved in cell wall biosynthesis